jgi:preprotein translocase subunit SecE
MGGNRWVHMMFATGGLLLSFVLVKMVEWVWGYFGKPNDLIATAIGIVVGCLAAFLAWRHAPTFAKAQEITLELKKVTWPTRKETSAATTVVIVTVIIAAILLGVFDIIWSWATGLLYKSA